MITLTTANGSKVLLNPSHVILVKEAANTFGESYVEVYHSAAKAPLSVKQTFDEVHQMLYSFYKK